MPGTRIAESSLFPSFFRTSRWPRLISRLAASALAFLPFTPAQADVIILTNGSKLEGEVIESAEGLRLRCDSVESVIKRENIAFWKKQPLPEEEYRKRASQLTPEDVTGQLELARWCVQQHLADAAKWHFTLALAVDPENAEARREAGFVKSGGQWLTREEVMRRRGLVSYNGRWLPEEEALRRQLQDDREQRSRDAYNQTWQIVRDFVRHESADPAPAVEQILALGPDTLRGLARAAADNSPRANRLALEALGRMSDRESLQLLFKTVRFGRNEDSINLALARLAGRSDREAVLVGCLDLTVNHGAARVRKRAALALKALGDPRAVESLLPLVEYTPAKPQSDDKTPPPSKDKNDISQPALLDADGDNAPLNAVAAEPFYPARDALAVITGQWFPASKTMWRNWWDRAKAGFTITPPPELAQYGLKARTSHP